MDPLKERRFVRLSFREKYIWLLVKKNLKWFPVQVNIDLISIQLQEKCCLDLKILG